MGPDKYGVWVCMRTASVKRRETAPRGAAPAARRHCPSPAASGEGRMSIVIYYSEIFIRRSRCSETGHSTHTRPRVNEHSRLPCALPCHQPLSCSPGSPRGLPPLLRATASSHTCSKSRRALREASPAASEGARPRRLSLVRDATPQALLSRDVLEVTCPDPCARPLAAEMPRWAATPAPVPPAELHSLMY